MKRTILVASTTGPSRARLEKFILPSYPPLPTVFGFFLSPTFLRGRRRFVGSTTANPGSGQNMVSHVHTSPEGGRAGASTPLGGCCWSRLGQSKSLASRLSPSRPSLRPRVFLSSSSSHSLLRRAHHDSSPRPSPASDKKAADPDRPFDLRDYHHPPPVPRVPGARVRSASSAVPPTSSAVHLSCRRRSTYRKQYWR